MDVNERILDAIELLANNSVQKAGYDKTIQAQILSCQDQVVGKYRCKYQDAVFYAYTNNPDIRLSKGTLVYILVPGNDMQQQKTIIGTVDKLGADYISAAVGDQAYNVIGSNVIYGGAAPNDKFYLDIDIADYSYDIYDIDNNIDHINLHIDELNQYIKQASSIIIGMNVKTNIPSAKQKLGNYGIKFSLEFKDEKGNDGIIRDYILDEDRMIDNPYNLIYPTRQYAIFDIDSQNFIKVKKITIFNKDFPGSQGEDHTRLQSGQIELTNFELSCAVRMSEAELNGLGLSIISPRGLIFLNANDEPKILQAQVKFKGRVVAAENVSFYWGIEDLQVTPQSEGKYNKYLGRGWRCINDTNIIQPQNEAEIIQWVSYGDTYNFPIEQAIAKNNRMRVAAVYDGNAITKQVNVQNFTSSAISIQITSTAGTQFYNGIGQTQLICASNYNSNPGYSRIYAWGQQNNGGQLQQFINNTTNVKSVLAKDIYNFSIYRCSMYERDQDGDHLIGTASIKLSNSMQANGTINPLVIQNGTVLYKYNEKGISPVSVKTLYDDPPQQGLPQVVPTLRFKLYDETGEEIPIFSNGLLNSKAKVNWLVPKNNTLLKLLDSQSSVDDQSNQQYYIIQNTETLTYDLVERYDPRKTINQIILQVTYDGAISRAQTNLTFIKQGQIGTNGTDYYVNIIPNTRMVSPPLFPMITKFNNGDYKLNYELDGYDDYTINPDLSSKPLLKVQFLHGSEPVPSGYTIKWRVLKNRYGTQNGSPVEDESDFTINQSTGIMTYTGNLTLNDARPRANIIECEITYDGHIYYGAIPFITAYMINESSAFDLVDGTGFHYVMYSSEGMQPEYSSLPFEFTDGNHGTCQVLGNIRTYDNVNRNWDTYENSGDLIQNSQDQFKIQPIGFYKGECVNNSVRYTVTDENNNLIGIINIPIHFYLNRYNFAHLNGWDGNSIQINEEDGYILAPQLGAGAKDTNNRFTGVLMGQVKNPMKNQSNIGLFGYAQGERSFFINSENGSAIFGKSGNGEIIIDPRGNKAMLYSHNYWDSYDSQTGLPSSYTDGNIRYTNEVRRIQNDSSLTEEQKNEQIAALKGGLLIDLTTPQIKFGSDRFSVDSQGLLHAQNATISGNITANSLTLGNNVSIGQNYIAGLSDDLSALTDGVAVSIKKDGAVSTTSISQWEQNKSYSSNSYVNDNGVIYRCSQYHTSSSSNRPPSTYWEEDIPSSTFLVSSNGLLTANNAVIYGTLYSSAGKIGGWTIGDNKLYTNRSTFDGNVIGIYIGTDGISVGSGTKKTFSVSSTGNVQIEGNITLGAGSTISWSNIDQKGEDPNITTVRQTADDAYTRSGTAITTANTASTTATTASDNVVALANGVYANGGFISNRTISKPIIIADSFYAQPETVQVHQSGHFILQTPATISGSDVISWAKVLDITYGYDGFRPNVNFITNQDGSQFGYFNFSGGEVKFDNGMQLPSSQTFLNYGIIKFFNGSKLQLNEGKMILKQYRSYVYDYSQINTHITDPQKGQLCFVLD